MAGTKGETSTIDEIFRVLIQVRDDMAAVKNDITQIMLKLDIMNDRMELVESRVAALEDSQSAEEGRLTNLINHVDDLGMEITQRTAMMEGTLEEHGAILHPPYDPEKTIIAIKLPETNSSTMSEATALLNHGLGDHTQIVRATRLHGRNGQPGIVKIELPSKEDTIRILRKKSNLVGKSPYERTFLRSSQPHSGRVNASNIRLIMERIPAMSDLRLTADGRLVPANERQRLSAYRGRHSGSTIAGNARSGPPTPMEQSGTAGLSSA